MEVFIDLGKLAESRTESPLPGIDLNLSGLVNFNKPAESLEIKQGQLKNEAEIITGGFNPVEYFNQIQEEFKNISGALESKSVKDDRPAFQAALANSNVALDPLTSYLESRLTKIESLTTDRQLIRELIQGKSENALGETGGVQVSPLKQVESLEKVSSVESIANTINNLAESISTNTQNLVNRTDLVNTQNEIDRQALSTSQNNIETVSRQLTNEQELKEVNRTSEFSYFNEPKITGQGMVQLAEAKREPLPMVKEVARPDFSAPTLSAIRQMAENTAAVAAGQTINQNSTNSQYSNTQINQSAPSQSPDESVMPGDSKTVVLGGGQSDNSSMYLLQMLNLFKSGQLKVKIG